MLLTKKQNLWGDQWIDQGQPLNCRQNWASGVNRASQVTCRLRLLCDFLSLGAEGQAPPYWEVHSVQRWLIASEASASLPYLLNRTSSICFLDSILPGPGWVVSRKCGLAQKPATDMSQKVTNAPGKGRVTERIKLDCALSSRLAYFLLVLNVWTPSWTKAGLCCPPCPPWDLFNGWTDCGKAYGLCLESIWIASIGATNLCDWTGVMVVSTSQGPCEDYGSRDVGKPTIVSIMSLSSLLIHTREGLVWYLPSKTIFNSSEIVRKL